MKKKRLTEAERLKREASRCFGDSAKLAPEDRVRRRAPDPTPAYLFEHAEKLLNRTARRRNDSNDFEVQEIVDEDFCSGNLCNEPHARRREFKIRFVGYGPEGDEWLPRSKIDADDLISAFRAQHPPPVSPAESTDDESDNEEQAEEQVPLVAPSPPPARVREAQRNNERVGSPTLSS
ncbi:hypothetical protein AAVH_22470 [Aphelenchoides avenae]|nr:hypothetical protein AAVH_22470 [Aphelenchus avenae]